MDPIEEDALAARAAVLRLRSLINDLMEAGPARLRQVLDNVLANALKHTGLRVPVVVHESPPGQGASFCLALPAPAVPRG